MNLRLQRYDLDARYKKGKELYLSDTLSRHFSKLTETTREHREHVLLTRSAFEEGIEVEQDIQEIMNELVNEPHLVNPLLVNEREAEMFRVGTKNDDDFKL